MIPCTIYTLTGILSTQIEVQKCKVCPGRYIGPDGREMGLFNWNNRTLYTWELLDDYTSSYTSSETPFVAWVTVVNRRYLRRGPMEFVSDKTFRAVWFSYVKLMALTGDMTCSKCGPNPDVTIFDGVTLAFNRKNLLSTMRPPTTITATSEVKGAVRPAPNLQCIKDKMTRKNIRYVLLGPKISLPDLANLVLADSGPRDEEYLKRIAEKKKAEAMIDRIYIIPDLVKDLLEIDSDMGAMFDLYFGERSVTNTQEVPSVYRKLFLQVFKLISDLGTITD